MKKTITLALACLTAYSFSYAQIKKDAVLAGGGISFYSSKDYGNPNPPETKHKSTFFNLSVGKAIKENTVVGIYGGYGQNKSEYNYNSNTKNTNTVSSSGAGIFFRKYKMLGKGFYFLGEIDAGYTGYKEDYATPNPVNNTTISSNGLNLVLIPGLSYQLFTKMQLEVLMPSFAGLQYATSKTTNSSGTVKGNAFQFSTGLNNGTLLSNLSLGFRFVL
ncbi:MAG: hypothetical protein U0V75_11010 [Ferruginibacter sp.]